MAKVGSTYLTLADALKQQDSKGEVASTIIEMMSETNEILQDANVMECNDGTAHLTTIRTGLPSAVFRKLYGFVPPSKSTTAQVKDTTGMLETYSVVDKDLVEKQKNPNQFRLNEAQAFLEAMNTTLQDYLFYGNSGTDPAAFDGLSVRYGAYSSDTKKIGNNVVKAGGASTDNTSIWFITWGDLHTSLIYPQGSQAGIQHTDDGVQTETDSSGGKRKVYQDHFKMDVGLTVRDWRSTCRIANIDVSDLAGATPTAIDNYMLQAWYKIRKYAKTGRTMIYANSETLYALHRIAKDKSNVNLSINEFNGQEIVTFLGKIPIREAEQILNTEDLVA